MHTSGRSTQGALAAYIKERGGLPFLTDCNTLYVGSRKNALEHIETAYINGYTPYATGCQVIIADGVRGTDEAYIPIGCEEVKTAKIGPRHSRRGYNNKPQPL